MARPDRSRTSRCSMRHVLRLAGALAALACAAPAAAQREPHACAPSSSECRRPDGTPLGCLTGVCPVTAQCAWAADANTCPCWEGQEKPADANCPAKYTCASRAAASHWLCSQPQCSEGATRCEGTASVQACGNDLVWSAPEPCPAGKECRGTACAPPPCSDGWETCGGGTCATNVKEDPDNCGGCGRRCPESPGLYRGCANRVCTLCKFADCSGRPTLLASDPENCGACGRVCRPAPHSGPSTCVEGTCRPGACLEGFADCNGNLADGCEADLGRNPRNCGGCGVVCPAGAACLGGSCERRCPAGTRECADGTCKRTCPEDRPGIRPRSPE